MRATTGPDRVLPRRILEKAMVVPGADAGEEDELQAQPGALVGIEAAGTGALLTRPRRIMGLLILLKTSSCSPKESSQRGGRRREEVPRSSARPSSSLIIPYLALLRPPLYSSSLSLRPEPEKQILRRPTSWDVERAHKRQQYPSRD